MAMNSFWRVTPPAGAVIEVVSTADFPIEVGLATKLRPRHGILLGHWRESSQTGHVLALGVVLSVDAAESRAKVRWVATDITLKPNPAGARFWRTHPFFKFAANVAIRYMLDDLFAEHFPDASEYEFGSASRSSDVVPQRAYREVPGYVYLIKSEYGYKIGKTVNIKVRTRLFEVKLPFPIEVLHYAWFENYSKVECDLHARFATKRLEGEWFELDDTDIRYIRGLGKAIPVEQI